MNKKQQLLGVLAEQLILHKELPDIRVVCSKLSITIDEYAELLTLCTSEELRSVFSVLTPVVIMNIFHQTTENIPAQKLWSELFLKSSNASNSNDQHAITVQFIDEPVRESNSQQQLMKKL